MGHFDAAEAVLRRALETPRAPGRCAVLLQLDLAELCSVRREAAVVLELVEQAERGVRGIEALERDPEIQVLSLRLRCQAWIDLGCQERVAALTEELGKLAPRLPEPLRPEVALQRANGLLQLSAWAALERLASEELAGLTPERGERSLWLLRRGFARSEIARLAPERAREARGDLEGVLADEQLAEGERTQALLVLSELELRAGQPRAARERLTQCTRRSDARGQPVDDLAEADEELRAQFQGLAIEVELASGAGRAELERRLPLARGALQAVREGWARRPKLPGGQSFLLFSDARFLLGQLARLQIALEGERAGVEAAIEEFARLQGAGTAARGLDLGSIDAARLRRELIGSEATLLVILPNSLRTHVFALGPTGALAGLGAPLEALEALRDEHRGWLERRPAAADGERALRLSDSAGRLRDALFDARVLAELRARIGLLVVGDDVLGGIALEALELDGRSFGRALAVAHLPSLPMALELRRRSAQARPAGAWDVVVFGAPVQAANAHGLEALGLGADELGALGQGFPRERVALLHGEGATLENLARAELAPAALLQILTHGLYDPRRAEPAGVLVTAGPSGSDVAWRADLCALHAPRVVGLWACGSERGPARFGDDTAAHLGGAFLEAGACSVVLSRSDIALAPTLRLARGFSQALARGESPAEALRAARDEVATDPATADPFFHATVALYGDPGCRDLARAAATDSARRSDPAGWNADPARAPTGSTHGILIALAIAAALVAAWLVLRARSRAG